VRTEAAILDAMRRLMAGRTTFMIAHRLTTLQDCDLRFSVEDGRLSFQAPERDRPGTVVPSGAAMEAAAR
jgi:ABC-type multidrug transport system fused ATPase/permease subunit